MKSMVFLFLLLLVGCAATTVKTEEPVAAALDSETVSRPLSKRIYYLQHKVISKWVFESSGAFFADLQAGNTVRLLSVAERIVTPEYAQGVTVTPVDGKEAVLIRFPEPTSPANCFFALIEKTNDGFSYYTYEKTLNLGEYNVAGVLGGWDQQGQHSNYGPRSYKTFAEFIKDALGE